MFLTQHALYQTHTSSKWQQTGDLGGATDRTAAANPTIKARDFGHYTATMPSTGATVYYFVANVTGAYDIDCAAVIGHNFSSISATSVDLILSTDNLFDTGTNSVTVKTWSSPGVRRLGATSLYHTGAVPLKYSGATWIALKITCGSSQIPSFTELWLGERVQMPYKPNVMWDPTGPIHNNITRVWADNGAMAMYFKNYGQRKVTAEWSLANTAANQSIVNTGLYSYTTGFIRPFLFWETPYSDAAFYNVMVMDNEFRWELVGPSERVLSMEMTELAPFYRVGN
jgi:hypothetical protein